MNTINIFWFRRDLRIEDNIGLSAALESDKKTVPIFIFDTEILDQLENKYDRRVDFIHQALTEIHEELKKHHSGIKTYYGKPLQAFKEIIQDFDVATVYCNRDYEPNTIKRDKEVSDFLQKNNIECKEYKDQVIFEKEEITKNDGLPYTVYTPFSKKWKEKLQHIKIHPAQINVENFYTYETKNIHSLKDIGFEKTDLVFSKPILDKKIIESYDKNRDFPALDQTTRLGIDLRFGTISIRKCVKYALEHNEVWLNELIWREFFMQILYHFPKVVTTSFKEKYENIQWRNNEKEFKLWCQGKTGYPIVDSGMIQLNKTGFMHNRVRMIVASFLTKHLLIDWRWGEAYFAEKLLDYELSSNNGNWQWAAGCGCDAAPYFRVFNPSEQTKKFDQHEKYIKTWLPDNYSDEPIVEHKFARERALETYKKAVKD